MVGLLGTLRGFIPAIALHEIEAEVEVEPKVFEAMHFIVELGIPDETLDSRLVIFFFEEGNRVHGRHGVYVSAEVAPY